jgi:hypothetical protein
MSPSHPSRDLSLVGCQGLTSSQRSRLLRSTRKLAKILGETPVLQIKLPSPPPKPSPPQRYQGNTAAAQIVYATKKLARTILLPWQSIHGQEADNDSDSIHSNGSGLVTANNPSRGRGGSPVQSYDSKPSPEEEANLCNTYISSRVPSMSPSSKKRRRPSSLISISTSKSLALSPTEWEKWREGFETRSRRKRLAKLARHLGESIPPDLILSTQKSSARSKGSPRRGPPSAGHTPPVSPIVPPSHAERPTLAQTPNPSLPPPHASSDVPPPEVTQMIEVFESMGLMPQSRSTGGQAPPNPFAQQEHRQSCCELTLSLQRQRVMQPRADECFVVVDHTDANTLEEYKEHTVSVSSRPGSPLALLRLRHTASSPEPKAVSHRRERRQGWSGEWNAASMQEVISKLRDL